MPPACKVYTHETIKTYCMCEVNERPNTEFAILFIVEKTTMALEYSEIWNFTKFAVMYDMESLRGSETSIQNDKDKPHRNTKQLLSEFWSNLRLLPWITIGWGLLLVFSKSGMNFKISIVFNKLIYLQNLQTRWTLCSASNF